MFGNLPVRLAGNNRPLCALEDVNQDSIFNLVCKVEYYLTLGLPVDGIATLRGMLSDGTPIEGYTSPTWDEKDFTVWDLHHPQKDLFAVRHPD